MVIGCYLHEHPGAMGLPNGVRMRVVGWGVGGVGLSVLVYGVGLMEEFGVGLRGEGVADEARRWCGADKSEVTKHGTVESIDANGYLVRAPPPCPCPSRNSHHHALEVLTSSPLWAP